MKKIFLVLLMAACNIVVAQDVFQEKFYAPELVLKYREETGLSADQVEKIKNIYNSELPAYNNKKWDLDAEMTKLEKLISESSVDAKAAAAQLEKALVLEAEIKKMKLNMLVKVKNTLTAEQQVKLNAYKGDVVSSSTINATLSDKQNVTVKWRGMKIPEKPLFHIINGAEDKMVNEMPADIDSNEIDSITVLRAESAKAIYGERGENGVIVIRLKKKK